MYIEIDGQEMFYSTGNGTFNADQPSVVFIHGAGLDHSVWVLPSRYFARHGYNVVSLDLPAHGRSRGQPLNSIEDMATLVSELIQAIGIPVASVVGHSMGSLVALTLAANNGEQVRRLALLGTAVPMRVSEQLLAAAEANSHDAIEMSNVWSHSHAGQMGGNENPGMWMMGAEQRLLERAGKGVYFADFTACNNFSLDVELAGAIACPALIIVGGSDIMTPPGNAETVAAVLPDCRITVLDNCGHSMLSEKPDQLLDELITIV